MATISIRRRIEAALPTAAELLRLRGHLAALRILNEAEIELSQTDYDNLDGGTEGWTASLRIPVRAFHETENERADLERQIDGALVEVIDDRSGFRVNARIRPIHVGSSLVARDGKITPRIRAAVLDEMRARDVRWNGALDEVDFLGRIFDLSALPSHDSRFANAAQDIYQHCINNDDWAPDWVYSDPRFRLYSADQDVFLHFLTEVLHPLVRRDRGEQSVLAEAFNGHLRRCGWELVETEIIDGRPTFEPERRTHGLGTSVQRIRAVAASLSSDTLYEDLRRLERIGDTEPGEAIGIAKELVEGCCKHILDDRGVAYPEKAEIPQLLKLLRTELRIMPDEIGEDAKAANEIRDILTSLGKIAHSLGPIRNAYGKGHGRGRDFKGLEPRHARLAIGAASTFVDFVLDRHRTRK